MSKVNVNKILYIVITVLIIWIVGSLFLAALPWLILAGLALWIFFKLKKIFSGNKELNAQETMYYKEDVDSDDTICTEQVIDVEYEDIKK